MYLYLTDEQNTQQRRRSIAILNPDTNCILLNGVEVTPSTVNT
jgi:hypothetical protein